MCDHDGGHGRAMISTRGCVGICQQWPMVTWSSWWELGVWTEQCGAQTPLTYVSHCALHVLRIFVLLQVADQWTHTTSQHMHLCVLYTYCAVRYVHVVW